VRRRQRPQIPHIAASSCDCLSPRAGSAIAGGLHESSGFRRMRLASVIGFSENVSGLQVRNADVVHSCRDSGVSADRPGYGQMLATSPLAGVRAKSGSRDRRPRNPCSRVGMRHPPWPLERRSHAFIDEMDPCLERESAPAENGIPVESDR